ncbi:MAG: helix-turn-helix domain-containing protein [Deltaproteobacteria bacterium]|jgi:sugar diacid utilization regulator|nr:helix-turn-helix domain-containing protein [Deltaproteobacteria bacterium]
MDVLKLSMDIIAECLRPETIRRHLQPDTGRTLSKAEFHVPGMSDFDPGVLYMVDGANVAGLHDMPRDTSVVILNCPQNLKRNSFSHLNLIGLGGDRPPMEAANGVLRVFSYFLEVNKDFTTMIQRGDPLSEVIDRATDIVGVPLCMIDTFHNVLALSTKLEPKGDKFWDVMKEGFGYGHIDKVQESEPKLSEMIEGQPVEMLSNIGGNMIRVTLMFKNRQPIAALGMHKMEDAKKHFEKHQVHLYEYVIEKLLERLQLFSDVKVGRGLVFERFLTDILDGKPMNFAHVHQLFQEIGMGKVIQFQLGVITFVENKHKTDLFLTVLNYVEVAIPNSRCLIKDNEIIILWPRAKGEVTDPRIDERLITILTRHNCTCVWSSTFSSLTLLQKVNFQLHDIFEFIDTAGAGGTIHHYHNYAKMHAVKLLSKVTTLETAVHPAIQILKRHDAEKKLNYLGTLKVYLRNNCRTSVAAKILNMHRNSLVNRINQIETLLGCSFNNWKLRSQLIFSFDCEEYIERYLRVE